MFALGAASRDDVSRIFYKFRSIGSPLDRTRAIEILKLKVFFASPSSFNDPFDCSPYISNEYTRDEFIDGWCHLTLALGAHRHIGEALTEAVAEWDIRISHPKRSKLDEYSKNGMLGDLKKSGVFCVNTDPWNPLVWAHYADNHRGLAFQFSEIPGDGICMAIDYSRSRTPVRVLSMNPYRLVEAALFQKAPDWSYEREWRRVHRNKIGSVSFDRQTLTGVILGACMPARHKELVRRAVARWLPEATIYQAVLSDKTFDIAIPDLPTDKLSQAIDIGNSKTEDRKLIC